MRQMLPNEMINLVSLFAVLLIFFSVDLRGRDFPDDHPWHARMFSWLSRIGGIATAIAMTVAWISMYIPDESESLHMGLVAVPGSAAVLCTIALGVEMLFQRTPRK